MDKGEFNILANETRKYYGGEPFVDDMGGVYWPWHRWFAWHPTWIAECGWVWLRFIQRRYVYKHGLPYPIHAGWQYRTLDRARGKP